MRKIITIAVLAMLLLARATSAQDNPRNSAIDDELGAFRHAYTSGKGLAYVVMQSDEGEKIYRFGEASREAARKDHRGFMLFSCNMPRVFVVQDPKSRSALQAATVVGAGEPRFAELDGKFMNSCNNPLVKSAIP